MTPPDPHGPPLTLAEAEVTKRRDDIVSALHRTYPALSRGDCERRLDDYVRLALLARVAPAQEPSAQTIAAALRREAANGRWAELDAAEAFLLAAQWIAQGQLSIAAPPVAAPGEAPKETSDA